MPLSPSEQEDIEAIMTGCEPRSATRSFSAAWAKGRSLSQEEAVDVALSLRVETADSTTPNAESDAHLRMIRATPSIPAIAATRSPE